MSHFVPHKREREIARILAKNGYAWLWSKWNVGKVLGVLDKGRAAETTTPLTQPQRLRTALEQLGTTFIKLGQMLSTRPDLLPAEYLLELSKLQDDAPKVAYQDIEATIESEFGQAPAALFLSFDKHPRAAASIGQVHNAELPDGTPVVVKVRRPGIERVVEQDLAILGRLARFLSQNTELGRAMDVEGFVEEFAYTLRNELDFAREGQNAERIAAQFSEDQALHVPTVYWDYSTACVLTMEAIEGVKIDDFAALDAAGIDRKELAERCAHIALVQVLDHGFFHADPHPGNFFVQPDGVIALLDYGMVGRLGERLRGSLLRLALAVSRHDVERIMDELAEMGAAKGKIDRQGLGRELERLLSQYDGVPIGSISVSKLLREITSLAQRHGLTLPSDFVTLARVVAMDEGLGAALDPEFRFIEFSQPYFERFWKKSHSPAAVLKRAQQGAIDLAELGMDLPERLRRLEGMLERGEMTFTSRLELPEPLMKKVQLATNRIAISILAAGLIVGLSVMALVFRPEGSEGLGSFLLKALLGVGILLGAWLLGAFWKSSR